MVKLKGFPLGVGRVLNPPLFENRAFDVIVYAVPLGIGWELNPFLEERRGVMQEYSSFEKLLEKMAIKFASGANKVSITEKEFINLNCFNLLKKEGYSVSIRTYPKLHLIVQ